MTTSLLTRLILHRAALRWMTGFVLCALMLHGSAGVVLQVLGPSHRHVDLDPAAQVAVNSPGTLARRWQAMQAWFEGLRPQTAASHLFAHGAHEHRHGLFERHHHDPNDPSVVTLDGSGSTDSAAGEAATGASVGSVTMPLALAANLQLPVLNEPRRHWPRSACVTWRDAETRLPDKPPRG